MNELNQIISEKIAKSLATSYVYLIHKDTGIKYIVSSVDDENVFVDAVEIPDEALASNSDGYIMYLKSKTAVSLYWIGSLYTLKID